MVLEGTGPSDPLDTGEGHHAGARDASILRAAVWGRLSAKGPHTSQTDPKPAHVSCPSEASHQIRLRFPLGAETLPETQDRLPVKLSSCPTPLKSPSRNTVQARRLPAHAL